MRRLPDTNSELRARYKPLKTWAALSIVGLILSLCRGALYGLPLSRSMTPFFLMTTIGMLYAATMLVWLIFRQRRFR